MKLAVVLDIAGVGLMLFGIWRCRGGASRPYAWFWAVFAFNLSTATLLFTLGLAGVLEFEPRADDDVIALMFSIVLAESIAALCGLAIVSTLLGDRVGWPAMPRLRARPARRRSTPRTSST